jgi:hypothetical protein
MVDQDLLEADFSHTYTPSGEVEPEGWVVAGDVNINPGNSTQNMFELQTPDDTITRSTLLNEGSGFTYTGPATEIKVKPKSTGRSLTINGVTYRLDTNTQYTIESDDMSVYLRNVAGPGNAMGRWWLNIAATDATITPDPGVPEPEAPEVPDGGIPTVREIVFEANPGAGVLTLVNEDPKILGGSISINGSQVVTDALLASGNSPIEMTVNLNASNVMVVRMSGQSGGLSVDIDQPAPRPSLATCRVHCYGRDGVRGGTGWNKDIQR